MSNIPLSNKRKLNSEAYLTMLATEDVLRRDWDRDTDYDEIAEDLRLGRYEDFDTIDDFIASLQNDDSENPAA